VEQSRLEAAHLFGLHINPKDKPAVIEVEDRPADPFSTDSHITWAMYCIGLSMILTLIVNATSMGKGIGKPVDEDRDKPGKN